MNKLIMPNIWRINAELTYNITYIMNIDPPVLIFMLLKSQTELRNNIITSPYSRSLSILLLHKKCINIFCMYNSKFNASRQLWKDKKVPSAHLYLIYYVHRYENSESQVRNIWNGLIHTVISTNNLKI